MQQFEILLQKRRKRGKSFLDSSLSISGILHMLESTLEPKSFGKLRMESKIKYKASFIKYLAFCVKKKLITRTLIDPNNSKIGTIYLITSQGRSILDILQ